jgi:type I restriction enzyme S subunit
MSDLPDGWTCTTIKELAGTTGLFVDGDWIESKDQDPNGNIRLLQLADIGDSTFLDKSNRWINEDAFVRLRCTALTTGDVLVARMPDPLGRACLMPALEQRCVTVVDVAALRVDSENIDNRWVIQTINSPQIRAEIAAQSSGTTRRRISRGRLGEMEIPLPPKAEQTRIANQLDTLLARVQACNDRFDAIPALLKRFRQTVLDSATTGQLTDDWRIDKLGQATAEKVVAARLTVAGTRPTKAASEFFVSHQPVTPQKGTLPGTWLLTHIGMVGVVSNGSTPSRQEPSYWGSGIPWVSSGEVANGVIRRTREQITDSGFDNSSVRLLPRGSVLMAMIGEGKTRGQSAILDIDACINQNIAGVVPVDGILDSKYLWFWFRREYENTRTKGNGSGPKALNCERVRELEINLPPLPEQTEIVRRVEALFALADRIEARCTAARAQAQRLTPLVLAKAFRGELVPQDPNDEPASALLARIASSNTAVVGKNKRKVPIALMERS